MSLIKGIACKVEYLVINAVCDLFGNAALYCAVNAPFGVAVNECNSFSVDDLVLFFAHCAAYHIRLPE